MRKVKVIKKDGEIVLTLPNDADFKAGDEWVLAKKSGAYILVPKIANPYLNANSGELYEDEDCVFKIKDQK